jgi:hypothetical protein
MDGRAHLRLSAQAVADIDQRDSALLAWLASHARKVLPGKESDFNIRGESRHDSAASRFDAVDLVF